MRILVLATTFPRWQGDTEPAFVYDLSRHLTVWGHEITALVPHAPGAAYEEILPSGLPSPSGTGVHVIRFPYWYRERGEALCYQGGALPNLRSSWMARINLPIFLWQQRRWIGHFLRRESFDLLHSHWILPQGFFAVRHCRGKQLPVILTAHAGDVFPMKKPGLKSFLRYTLKQGTMVTANSRATAEALSQAAPSVHPRIIPMGVDLSRFRLEKNRTTEAHRLRAALVKDHQSLILCVGRLAPKKGQKYLLRAMPEVLRQKPDTRLVLIGEGGMKPELEQEIRSLGIADKVHFIGKVPHENIVEYFRASDVLVLPSIVSPSGDTEGQGVVLVEAMAVGVPVIASRVGGVSDVIEDGKTGILVPEKEPAALAQAIIQVLGEPELARRLAHQARQEVEARFSWEEIAGQFHELFMEVLSEDHAKALRR